MNAFFAFILFFIIFTLPFLFSFFFALPSIEGNIANAENFMLFPIITAAYFFWLAVGEQKKVKISTVLVSHRTLLIISGILLGIAFLFKTVAIFDFAAFSVFALLHTMKLKRNVAK